jgi:hypothetical protein
MTIRLSVDEWACLLAAIIAAAIWYFPNITILW